VLAEPTADETRARADMPPPAVRHRDALQQWVLVAPSIHFKDRDGLYPRRDFAAEETVCVGTSQCGKWVLQGEVGLDRINASMTIKETRVKALRPEENRFLLGDPQRDLWANINSCHGTGRKSNLRARRASDTMDDSYLLFTAAEPIKAFSGELSWTIERMQRNAETYFFLGWGGTHGTLYL